MTNHVALVKYLAMTNSTVAMIFEELWQCGPVAASGVTEVKIVAIADCPHA